MLSVLAENIHDNRFLRLIKGMLRAGYLEDWVWNATLSGAPQGGVVSPVLSNIYLDRLDKFAETVLIPEYTRGDRRVANPAGRRWPTRLLPPASAGTVPRHGSCASSGAACHAGILVTPATAGSGIPGTPMTISSGSPGRRPRPRISSSASPVPARRAQAGTVGGQDADHPRPYPRRGSSATTSSPSTARPGPPSTA